MDTEPAVADIVVHLAECLFCGSRGWLGDKWRIVATSISYGLANDPQDLRITHKLQAGHLLINDGQ